MAAHRTSAFPGRLTVRLRTLTPSIEVRILTGEPFIAFNALKFSLSFELHRVLALILSHIWIFIYLASTVNILTPPR